MTARRVTLNENDQVGFVASVSDVAARLLGASPLLLVLPERTGWRLVPRPGWVGAARVGDLEVEVRPKAPFASVLFMLGHARGVRFGAEDVAAESDELWPALAESLGRAAERALAQGVLQGYRTVEEDLTVVRGRLDTAVQARRPLPVPLAVRHDDFDVDIPENQILRTALRRMAAIAAEHRARLAHLEARLLGARLLDAGEIPSWRATPLNERYRPALRLAELILRNSGVGVSPGGKQIASFAVNMAGAFEGFVTTGLREALAAPGAETFGQRRLDLDEGGLVRLYPDVLHCRRGRPVAVFDAKYKLAESAMPNADVYQMLAYCTALRLPTGHLVYAGSGSPTSVVVRRARTEVWRWQLDTAAPPRDMMSALGAIGQAALDLAEREWP